MRGLCEREPGPDPDTPRSATIHTAAGGQPAPPAAVQAHPLRSAATGSSAALVADAAEHLREVDGACRHGRVETVARARLGHHQAG